MVYQRLVGTMTITGATERLDVVPTSKVVTCNQNNVPDIRIFNNIDLFKDVRISLGIVPGPLDHFLLWSIVSIGQNSINSKVLLVAHHVFHRNPSLSEIGSKIVINRIGRPWPVILKDDKGICCILVVIFNVRNT